MVLWSKMSGVAKLLPVLYLLGINARNQIIQVSILTSQNITAGSKVDVHARHKMFERLFITFKKA